MTLLSADDVRKKLRGLVRNDRGQSDLAKEAGVSPAYFSAVLAGKKKPSAKVLSLIGAKHIEVYIIDEATK